MILDAFKKNNGALTPSDIMRLGIAQYNARIFGLRRKGYRIDNEFLGVFNGVKHTRFSLRGFEATNLKTSKTLTETVKEYEQSKNPQNSLDF